MFDPNVDPNYNPRNLRKPKGSAWNVYKRLLGYTLRYKTRLFISLLFALVVAFSFTSVLVSIGVAVNVLFGNEEGVIERIFEQRDKLEKIPSFVTEWIPAEGNTLEERLINLVQQVRANDASRLKGITWLSVGVMAFMILAGTARYLQEYLAGTIGARISVRLGEEMFRNVMGLSLRFFEKHPSGEILARFTNDIFQVNRGLATVFVKLMREPIKALFFLGTAFKMDATLTLLGLCILPPVGYIILRIGKIFKRSVRRSLEKIADMATVASETFKGIVIVKGFCMEQYEINRTSAEFQKLRRYLVKMVKADALVGPLVEIFLTAGIVVFLLAAGHRVAAGKMMSGDLVLLCMTLAAMFDPVRKLASVNNLIQTSVASAERVFEFIDLKPDMVEAPNAMTIPPLQRSLEFKNVRFSYDGVNEVLKGVNFEVKKGEMVALVGFSGGGKTTIAKLLPRFYDVTGGAITIDGVDIRQATFESVRDQISIVTQDTILFNESVRDNIAFGRQNYSEDRIHGAATAAHADEFVQRLPDGYDTIIGESGGSLSGGQRQRLAIARAIVKDPAILIFDEATSNLDTESEQAIQKAIEEFVVGRTTLVIAHRLSTIQRADRILVVHEGRIVEQGAHRELLERKGIYARLYEMQFATAPDASTT